MRLAGRLADLPPYLFADLNARAAEAQAQGADVISLAAGDPDLPPLPHVVEALTRAIADPAQHRYPPYEGLPELRAAIARHYLRRYGVRLDPDRQVLVLIGGKEGFAHAVNALLEPGTAALVPDPGYPPYANQVQLAGGLVRPLPLTRERRWLPDWGSADARAVRMAFLNYPSNPTGAVCQLGDLAEAVAFCREHRVALVHDLAYGELTFDGHEAPSVLQVPGGDEVAIEIMSLSKTYRMAGMRMGAAVGNAEIVGAMRVLKSHFDTGQFRAIQHAAIAALEGPQDHIAGDREIYRRRRDRAIEGLRLKGLDPDVSGGSLYVWARLPEGILAHDYARRALAEAAVLVTPGGAYGPSGQDYVRVALTVADDRLAQALDRLPSPR